jgi:hypothetical protein
MPFDTLTVLTTFLDEYAVRLRLRFTLLMLFLFRPPYHAPEANGEPLYNAAMSDDQRIFVVGRFAAKHGFKAGIPTFEQDMQGDKLVFGYCGLKDADVDVKGVNSDELKAISSQPWNLFLAVHNYAIAHGYKSGFPNYEQQRVDDKLLYGCVLIKANDVEIKDLKKEGDLHIPAGENTSVEGRFRAINNWASHNGFKYGYPNFNQGNGTWQAVLLKNVECDVMPVGEALRGDKHFPLTAQKQNTVGRGTFDGKFNIDTSVTLSENGVMTIDATISSEDGFSGFTGGIVVTVVDENGNVTSDKYFSEKYGVNPKHHRDIHETLQFSANEVKNAYALIIRNMKGEDWDRVNDLIHKASQLAHNLDGLTRAVKNGVGDVATIYAFFGL